jgi:hypothetical protein
MFFNRTTVPALGWIQRVATAKIKFPGMNEKEASTLANNRDLWEQKDTNAGHCRKNDFQVELKDSFGCINHQNI